MSVRVEPTAEDRDIIVRNYHRLFRWIIETPPTANDAARVTERFSRDYLHFGPSQP